MGGYDSQKLRPWRGSLSSPGRSSPPAYYQINTVTDTAYWMTAVPGGIDQHDAGSATKGLGHSWKTQVAQSLKAPKS